MMGRYFVGIDAGSTYLKVAMLDQERDLVGCDVASTGIDANGTAKRLMDGLCQKHGVEAGGIAHILATGYSRRNIGVAQDTVTEIQAHAKGAVWSAPPSLKIRTVVDIGGQDSKVIVLDDQGEISNFVMNDKCAAGTGRFLESLSRVLEIGIDQLGPVSLESVCPLSINSTCVVFAESEVISLIARSKKREDIAAGIHQSLASRIGGMARHAGAQAGILLTGGGGLNCGIAKALERELQADIHVSGNPQLNGAIGAAIIAQERMED